MIQRDEIEKALSEALAIGENAIRRAADVCERLIRRAHSVWFDEHYGTSCEQIRHAQEFSDMCKRADTMLNSISSRFERVITTWRERAEAAERAYRQTDDLLKNVAGELVAAERRIETLRAAAERVPHLMPWGNNGRTICEDWERHVDHKPATCASLGGRCAFIEFLHSRSDRLVAAERERDFWKEKALTIGHPSAYAKNVEFIKER